MLVIRQEQLRVLQQDQKRRFEQELAADLRRRFPQSLTVADPEQLRSFVHDGVSMALSCGMVNRYDIGRFLQFRAEYGADFHQQPWAARILNDPTLSGSGKIEQIDDYSLFVLRP
jgi:hypothetical protein